MVEFVSAENPSPLTGSEVTHRKTSAFLGSLDKKEGEAC